MLIRIKNASAVKKETVFVPYSKMKMAIAAILEKEGYIKKAEHRGKKAKKVIEIILNSGALSDVRRISKPGLRVYAPSKELSRYSREKGLTIISTSKGIFTAKEAKQNNLGGELLCRVW